jgi:transposase-like protein
MSQLTINKNGGSTMLPLAPDPEVLEKPKRRRFTAEYKHRILQEADACQGLGEVGALLRREGLYSSHLSSWRAQRRKGSLSALKPKKVTPETKRIAELERQLKESEREKARLEARLKRADLMLELQKKCSEILGVTLPPPSDESDS